MSYTYLSIEREHEGQIAIVTLNRPERLNALSPELTAELHAVLDEIHRDRDLRVAILTGAGEGFCSGADVSGMARRLDSEERPTVASNWLNRVHTPQVVQLSVHLRATRQPIIAAVNGVAAGAGMSIALASDIRIGSERTRFAMRFVKRSIVADTGSTHTLPRLVGAGIAAELMFTGRVIDAETAKEMRLVNRIVPHAKLMDTVRELA
jgi:enoyl-CoA hydratase